MVMVVLRPPNFYTANFEVTLWGNLKAPKRLALLVGGLAAFSKPLNQLKNAPSFRLKAEEEKIEWCKIALKF